jgi:hypothetical protein
MYDERPLKACFSSQHPGRALTVQAAAPRTDPMVGESSFLPTKG